MTTEKISITTSSEVLKEVDARGENRSQIITQSLARYFVLIADATRSLREKLSDDEISIITRALKSLPYQTYPPLPDSFDTLRDSIAFWTQKHDAQLSKKIQKLGECEVLALIDIIERS